MKKTYLPSLCTLAPWLWKNGLCIMAPNKAKKGKSTINTN